MARFDGLIGPSYRMPALAASCQRSVNLMPVRVEAPEKSPWVLMSTPGRSLFATLGDGPHRGAWAMDGRALMVSGDRLYEVFSDGTSSNRGAVAQDAWPATLCSNGTAGNQVFITSGGRTYIFNLSTNTLTQVSDVDMPFPVSMGGFTDGYFFALKKDSRQFNTSALEDGLSWDGLDLYERSLRADNLRALVITGRVVLLLGSATAEPWYNSGDPATPFQAIPGALFEQGTAAPFSATRFAHTIAWLSEDERGGRMVSILGPSYTPVRISTNALEAEWRTYTRVDDAEAYSYQEDGESFLHLTFPTAQTTFVYALNAQQWHERAAWDATRGMYLADRARTHCYAFGKHLVGDRYSGKVFEQSLALYDDGGDVLRRMRRGPHLTGNGRWVFHRRLELGFQMGVGLSSGQGSSPQVALRYSDDFGHTWSSERLASLGAQGDYGAVVEFYRLGRARNRVYEFAVSDPVQVVLTDAQLDVTLGVH